ncbi:glycerol ether metabolic process [Nesidiocoris tenuis]|uniref:Glycerol ether metabolic process n=1 Tax=Nesidiocoris tenuis TaxID=355587 RepID=A0ABN7AUH5_9HEMI|nr:glycerol ether metabolic process [Nesidiocoris tenuis]
MLPIEIVSGLASARKMTKKGGTATLQVEINSDEEWDTLLDRKGLIVVDVFTEWCGPCVAMMSNLKKVKLEHGSDNLHLAVGNADQVTPLSRFKGRSEPTWLFVAGGELLRVFFGSNAPALMKLIVSEVQKEIKVMEGKAQRAGVPWDELTEEEKKKKAELDAKRQAELDKIRAEEDAAKERVRRRNLERIARQLTNLSVVVFFPHAITEPEDDGSTKRTCQAAYQLMVKYEAAGLQIVDQLDKLIAGDEYNQVFFNSPLTIPEGVVAEMSNRRCLVSLIQEAPAGIAGSESPDRQASSSASASSRASSSLHPPQQQPSSTPPSPSPVPPVVAALRLNGIEEKMSTLIYGDSRDPENPSLDSVAYVYGKEIDEGKKFLSCWTPVQYISKTSAMQVLFPHKIAALDVVLEDLPPPSYVIVFEASRASEVLEVAEPFADDVIHLGFFTTDNPETAEKICHTIHDLEKKGPEVIAEAKMVIALKKSNSDPMLTLASLGPLYVSPDLRTGTKEMEMWFPPTIEMVPEPSPWAPPPPPPPKYFKDEEDNLYIEEERQCEDGEMRLCRKLVKLADGSSVEDSEWEPVVSTVADSTVIVTSPDETENPKVDPQQEANTKGADEALKDEQPSSDATLAEEPSA